MKRACSRCLQSTQRKDAHNGDLLPPRQVEAFQRRHRVYDDQDVCEDVDCGVGKPKALLAETVSVDAWLPEFGHWYAVEPRADKRPGAVD